MPQPFDHQNCRFSKHACSAMLIAIVPHNPKKSWCFTSSFACLKLLSMNFPSRAWFLPNACIWMKSLSRLPATWRLGPPSNPCKTSQATEKRHIPGIDHILCVDGGCWVCGHFSKVSLHAAVGDKSLHGMLVTLALHQKQQAFALWWRSPYILHSSSRSAISINTPKK